MKGLLIKDLCILKNQKRILPIYALLSVWFTVVYDDGFAFSFLVMMGTILTTSTISHDEADHSQTYLFALPFERKTYVAEKFLLGGLLILASLVLSMVCTGIRALFFRDVHMEGLLELIIVSISSGLLILAVMIPLRIRFSGDQGRIILYSVFAMVALGGAALSNLLPGVSSQVSESFLSIHPVILTFILLLVSLILVVAGFILARRWIMKKEF